jgi:hypothetical protein
VFFSPPAVKESHHSGVISVTPFLYFSQYLHKVLVFVLYSPRTFFIIRDFCLDLVGSG